MTGTITALRYQKRDKERVNVYLDDTYAFSLSLNAALGLKRGQLLTEADTQRLLSEDEVNRAYLQGLRWLSYRPRSQTEIERKFQQKEYSADAISAAIARLRSKSYLDDTAFARTWMENRERFRPRGARALRYELRQKGVDSSTINDVLADLDEEASAWAAIERKIDRWSKLDQADFRKKAMGFLSQRGFNYSTVRAISTKAWETLQGSDAESC